MSRQKFDINGHLYKKIIFSLVKQLKKLALGSGFPAPVKDAEEFQKTVILRSYWIRLSCSANGNWRSSS